MVKRLTALVILCVISSLVSAHEFWLEPDKFYFKSGETARVSFRVGEGFIGEAWKVNPDRIARIGHHADGKVRDLMHLVKDSVDETFSVSLAEEGTHLLVLESNAAFIKLDGGKFTEYLQEDGLDEILYARETAGISRDSATELYSRHTKLILQSGTVADDDFKKNLNLPIEIIPEKNPADLKKGDPISFKILYEGKPLFGAKVKVWNKYNHRISVQNIFSQQDGRIETHVSNPGAWMVSVIKMVPSKDPKAKYRSYWSSLVFGIR